MQAKLEEARKSAKRREGELNVTQGRVKDLEFLLDPSEVELASALSDKYGLETGVAELRAQLAKGEAGHAVGKKQLEKEMLMHLDLDNLARAYRRSWLSARICLRRRRENPTEARVALGGGGQQLATGI